MFKRVGCSSCHIADLTINHDRRVADVETVYDPVHGIFNNMFANATPLYYEVIDDPTLPPLKLPLGNSFVVKDIFTDFKRHDLGPNFYERNWDGTMQTTFLTRPLWGAGSTGPYGHDGRSIALNDVILRHGGEAQAAHDAYVALKSSEQSALQAFLNSLVLFPPDDTASNLDPGDPTKSGFPQFGHGSIKLTVLFNDPTDDPGGNLRVWKVDCVHDILIEAVLLDVAHYPNNHRPVRTLSMEIFLLSGSPLGK